MALAGSLRTSGRAKKKILHSTRGIPYSTMVRSGRRLGLSPYRKETRAVGQGPRRDVRILRGRGYLKSTATSSLSGVVKLESIQACV